MRIVPRRAAYSDLTVAGTVIPQGSRITLMPASGSRGPERFHDPDRFGPDRRNNQHRVRQRHPPVLRRPARNPDRADRAGTPTRPAPVRRAAGRSRTRPAGRGRRGCFRRGRCLPSVGRRE
ncbi:cytochrome P450 [Streptomyces sp. NPDC048279]|uniref:cytochrome P450 n=1 Tax=Streptomyces sp. NPDC048279 TaxID=3154714 RepID=UPI0034249DF8